MKILFFCSNSVFIKVLGIKIAPLWAKAKMPFKKTKIKGGKMEFIIETEINIVEPTNGCRCVCIIKIGAGGGDGDVE
jgi:hypothetical protein